MRLMCFNKLRQTFQLKFKNIEMPIEVVKKRFCVKFLNVFFANYYFNF